jgi:hypothetical protein
MGSDLMSVGWNFHRGDYESQREELEVEVEIFLGKRQVDFEE